MDGPQRGARLRCILHPLNSVPQQWGDIFWGVCFSSEHGPRFGVGPWAGA